MRYVDRSGLRWGGMALMMGLAVSAGGCGESPTERVEAPVARVEPTELVTHGRTRVDDYYWLRERENPEVVEYLTAENEYLDSGHGPRGRICARAVRRDRGPDQGGRSVRPLSFPATTTTRPDYEEGSEYPIHVRRAGAGRSRRGHGGRQPAGRGTRVLRRKCGRAWASARTSESWRSARTTWGRRKYTIRFLDLETGEFLADEIPDVTPNVAWAADDRTLFYTRQDPETLRWYQVFRHERGYGPGYLTNWSTRRRTRSSACPVRRTKSRDFVFITAYQTLSTEYRYLPAADPLVRIPDHPAARAGSRVLGRSLRRPFLSSAPTTRRRTSASFGSRSPTRPAFPAGKRSCAHRDERVLLEGFDIFRDHLVVEERENGLVRLRVKPVGWGGRALRGVR